MDLPVPDGLDPSPTLDFTSPLGQTKVNQFDIGLGVIPVDHHDVVWFDVHVKNIKTI